MGIFITVVQQVADVYCKQDGMVMGGVWFHGTYQCCNSLALLI